jgi:hypothetical protein
LPGQKTAWTKARFLTAGGVSIQAVRSVEAAGSASLAARALPGAGIEVTFELQGAAEARLTVADWSGRVLERQALGRLDTGLHRAAALQGRPSGVYIVTLETGRRALSARAVLP